jgi:hypothetical protein
MTTKIENYDWDTEFQKIRRERDSHRYFHVTKNGDRIRLKHLTDSHLNNIIAMIERNLDSKHISCEEQKILNIYIEEKKRRSLGVYNEH